MNEWVLIVWVGEVWLCRQKAHHQCQLGRILLQIVYKKLLRKFFSRVLEHLDTIISSAFIFPSSIVLASPLNSPHQTFFIAIGETQHNKRHDHPSTRPLQLQSQIMDFT